MKGRAAKRSGVSRSGSEMIPGPTGSLVQVQVPAGVARGEILREIIGELQQKLGGLDKISRDRALFKLFGAGLVAGLIGQIGDAINSGTMRDVGTWSARLLPYEALYQGGLDALTTDTRGLTGVIVQLGPFGGAQALGALTVVWAIVYGCGALALAAAVFSRRDL